MHRRLILAGMIVLLWTLGSQAQQPDSTALGSANPSASSQPVSGTIPQLVRFSGTVKISTGNLPTGAVGIIFSLYEQSEGGAPLWTETQSLQLESQGHYTALLGAETPGGLPLDLFTSSKALWLGVQPQLPGAVEQPRVLLVAVPYALKSSDADTLGGLPASAYMLTPYAGAAQAVSVPSPISFPPTNPVQPPSTPTNGSITGAGAAYFVPVFTGGTTIGNSSIYNTPNGQIGIGTIGPAATLHVNGTGLFTSTLTATGAVLPAAGAATSTEGFPSSPLDWIASSFDSSTSAAVPQLFRWRAEAADNNSASPSATLNLQFLAGTGTPSETGLSISSSGRINFAPGQTFPGTGSGTVTSVASGAGLTGGPITGTGTLSVATGGVTNAMLANPSFSVTAGTGLSGGGSAALGGSVTLTNSGVLGITAGTGITLTSGQNPTIAINTSTVPQLGASNNFTGSITASSFSGNGANLTSLSPANISAGTAGINITGSAASLTGNINDTQVNNLSTDLANATASAVSASEGYANGTFLPLAGGTLTGALNGTSANLTGALTGTTASFSGTVSASGALLPPTGPATASQGFISNPLDSAASVYNGGSSAAQNELFRWQAEPVVGSNDTASPDATLNLLFGANGVTPSETGLSISSNGIVTFASGQTFPGQSSSGTVTQVDSGPGLTGGPITGTGTLSIATGGVTNAMLSNPSLTVNSGAGLSGGGLIALGGNTTLSLNPNVSGSTGIFTSASSPVVSGTNSATSGFGQLGANVGGSDVGVYGSGNNYGTYGVGGTGAYGQGPTGVAGIGTGSGGVGVTASGVIYGVIATASTSDSAGVYSTGGEVGVVGSNSTNSSFGELGTSLGEGVLGEGSVYGVVAYGSSIGVSASSAGQGVYGANNTNGSYGELGTSVLDNATGVLGGGGSYGVYGSGSFIGVYGSGGEFGVSASGSTYGVQSTGGSYGVSGTGSGSNSVGVAGTGVSQGVYGLNSTNSGYGILGTSVGSDSVGAYGSATNYGTYGVGGTGAFGSGPTGVAGIGSGSGSVGVYGSGESYGVYSDGNFATSGTKSAVVALPDDRVVSLYAVESPENWFEDFGSGQLSNGVASIDLDPTFAQTISTEAGYHVFLTPNGDCHGLYVANKTASGFEVRELGGGKSNVPFDYRIVAKRKGLESLRMEQVSNDHDVAEGIRQFIAQRPSHTPHAVRHKQFEQPADASAQPQPPKIEAPKIQAPAIPAPAMVPHPRPPIAPPPAVQPPKLPALPKLLQPPPAPIAPRNGQGNEPK